MRRTECYLLLLIRHPDFDTPEKAQLYLPQISTLTPNLYQT
jgi:hypothetical protein